jgi:hypothetical protein
LRHAVGDLRQSRSFCFEAWKRRGGPDRVSDHSRNCRTVVIGDARAGRPSMRLAEEVEQICKRRRGDKAHDDGPAQKLLVPAAIGPSHPRQKVVAMFFFVFPRPKHKRPMVQLGFNSQTGRLWQTNIRGAGRLQASLRSIRPAWSEPSVVHRTVSLNPRVDDRTRNTRSQVGSHREALTRLAIASSPRST